MLTKAAVLLKKNKIRIKKIILPSLKKGQVLVKIKFSSICHTQVQEIAGQRGKDNFLPHCLGHEATGKVIQTHKSVRKVKKNDYVCLTWVFSKGINAGGAKYKDIKNKTVNAGPVNTFSNYSVVSENKIQKISKNNDLKKSVLLGCAAPTAFNSVLLNTKNQKKKNILILGAGGVGLLAVFASKLVKFSSITVVDKNLEKQKISKQLGASKTLSNLHDVSLLKDSFDYVLECSGSKYLLEKSIYFAKKFGGKVLVVGNYKHDSKLKIDPWQLLYGKKISGSWNKKFDYDNYFDIFSKYLKKFKINKYFGKKIYKLNQLNLALKHLKNGKVIRPLIKM